MKSLPRSILLFFMTLTCLTALGASPDDLFSKANEAYMDGAYQQAIDHYEAILDLEMESAPLYYNLGNAYFQLELTGMARLNYERAKRLDPRNDAILHNIDLLREGIPLEVKALPHPRILQWRDSFTGLQRADGWAWTAIFMILALSVSLAMVFYMRSPAAKKLFLALAAFLLIGIIISFYAAGKQYQMAYKNQHAIVMESNVAARSAPGDNGQELFILMEGIKVEIKASVNNWSEIRLPDGNTGWLPDDAFEVI